MFERPWGEDTEDGDFLSEDELKADEARLSRVESLFPDATLRLAIERFFEHVPIGDEERALADPLELLEKANVPPHILASVRAELEQRVEGRQPSPAAIQLEIATARTELARYWGNIWVWALELYEADHLPLSRENLYPPPSTTATFRAWDARRREYLDNMYCSVSFSRDEIPMIDDAFRTEVSKVLTSDRVLELPARVNLKWEPGGTALTRRV